MSEIKKYFDVKIVADNIWSIDGMSNDLMYLVVGSERAMLVDTGMGIGDLAGLVRSLTNLPLTVINTHGHPDHAGGNPNFDEVWMPMKDLDIMREMCADEYRLNDLKAFQGENTSQFEFLAKGLVRVRPYDIHPLTPGQVIDIGNRKFEVIETPGHTPGSICLLNSREKILFTGDSIVPYAVWMYLKHSVSIQNFFDGLKRLKAREDEFEILFPGHQPTPLGRSHLNDLLACAEDILDGRAKGELTKTFVGEGLLWKHGQGQIIYRNDNIR